MKKVMFDQVGIYRNEKDMLTAIEKVRELQARYKQVKVTDTGKVFNTELISAWELGCMLDLAEMIGVSALNRKESRGGHSREDYPERDDKEWLKHTLITKVDGQIKIGYKPVTITQYQPKVRVY
jgi:succinate dehydrogenase / fumarate reductase flavoprotein subunit